MAFPRRRGQSAAARRRRNLARLALVIVVTFVAGLFPPLRVLLVVNLVLDVCFIAYLVLGLLLAMRPAADERTPAPALRLQRAAAGGE